MVEMKKRNLLQAVRRELGIVWAIARKDVVYALQNKTILSLVVGVCMMVLMSKALPLILALSGKKTVVLYDAGRSRSIAGLKTRQDMRLIRVRSFEDMHEVLTTADEAQLGVVLPADLDQQIASGQPLVLSGYAAHWVGQKEVDRLSGLFGEALGELTGQDVTVVMAEERLYMRPEWGSMVCGVIVLVIVLTGSLLLPYLLMDERQSKTLDALRVSPATIRQVVVGKALAGSVYCFAAAGIVFAINYAMVVQWGLAVLAAFCCALFAIGVGLLMGSLFESAQAMSAVGGLLLALLVGPVYLPEQVIEGVPLIGDLVSWFPPVVLEKMICFSFSNLTPGSDLWVRLGGVLGMVLVLYLAVGFRMARLDR